MNILIAIPFRDRGVDEYRSANLRRVLEHWRGFGEMITVLDDGRDADAPFCRSAAYNRAAQPPFNADVIVYAESDMLIDYAQIREGIEQATTAPGLVVPFTKYRYLTPDDSELVRAGNKEPEHCTPEYTMDNGRSVGAINIVSRQTINAVGQWDEAFQGSWHDDRAMRIAFDITAGQTRFIDGSASHLYHLPGWQGAHLTSEDRNATAQNKRRYEMYAAAKTPERIRELTAGGK